jgi:hypothetical protein
LFRKLFFLFVARPLALQFPVGRRFGGQAIMKIVACPIGIDPINIAAAPIDFIDDIAFKVSLAFASFFP